MTKSRIRLSNTSVFTSTRRLLRDTERELEELINCPFLNAQEKEVSEQLYSQIRFCLLLSQDI